MNGKEIYEALYDNFKLLDAEKTSMCIGLRRVPRLQLSKGNKVYTSQGVIILGSYFPMLTNAKHKKEVLSVALYLIEHEVLHNFYTPDKAWKYGISKGTRTVFSELAKRLSPSKKWNFANERSYSAFEKEMAEQGILVSRSQIEHICHGIQNSLCDGRIERIGSNRSGIFDSERKLHRITFWKMNELEEDQFDITEPGDMLAVVLNQLLMIATTGLPQKNFYKLYRKTEAEEWLNRIKNFIGLAYYSSNCKTCMEWSVAVEKELSPLIAETIKEQTFENILSMLLDMKNELEKASASDCRGVKETDELMDDDDDAADQYTALLAELSKQEDDTEQDGDSKPEDSESEGESSEASDTDSEEEQSDSDSETSDTGKSSDSEESEDSDNSNSNESDTEENDSAMDDALNDAADTINNMIDNLEQLSMMDQDNNPKSIQKKKGKTALPQRDIQDAYKALEGDITFSERDYELNLLQPTPNIILTQAEIVSSQIEQIFEREKPPVLKGQKSGRLQGSHAWMLKGGDSEIFMRRQEEDFENLAFFILQDNSGSMDNGDESKRYYACSSAAVIEEALRNEQDHISLKISAFHAYGWNNVEHIRIKDWDEWQEYSNSYNYYTNETDGYGNKDGYSIRQATAELLERDEERKYLIVISDGCPTEYTGRTQMGQQDTKDAIQTAREAGITVIGLFISYEDSDTSDFEVFESMYEYNCLHVTPYNLGDALSNVIINACE